MKSSFFSFSFSNTAASYTRLVNLRAKINAHCIFFHEDVVQNNLDYEYKKKKKDCGKKLFISRHLLRTGERMFCIRNFLMWFMAMLLRISMKLKS